MSGRRWRLRILLPLLAGFAFSLPTPAAAEGPLVETAHVDDVINSVSAAYLGAAVNQAAADHAAALVLVINTPGGLGSAMDQIITTLLSAPLPVIAFVYPPGARADSAGLFVAQACDLVAMAPGTNIGSAHPIAGGGSDIGGDLGRKVLNDAVARVRGLATIHGRNPDWAEQAVRQSVNVGAEEALRLGVADLIAPDLPSLLRAVDGRTLPRPGGDRMVVHVAGARVQDIPMGFTQLLLHSLIDPNIAYLLLLVAAFGVIAEVSSPGAVLPGVVGTICGLLALISLASLPLNLTGILLVGFSFLLFIADVKAHSHGVLSVGGLVALVLGSALLINTGPIGLGVNPLLILAASALMLGLFAFIVRKASGARSTTAMRGALALVGTLGEARQPLDPEGEVFVAGALWQAVAAAPIRAGSRVRVTGREGSRLRVEAASDRPPGGGAGQP